ncbi:sugar phosphate isomerase/epimerase [Patulibacter sp. SYSU D01012]|uniref:sugar phosphate isomerase/epimerase family protein n=1 Tax=Patulibacter sp. SYSU D01012 TaxID=2817381 RepID=UPI001B30B245|nr:sugar phosphate isomerase/epimerase [Patulibacter sp. SYSU D01012]
MRLALTTVLYAPGELPAALDDLRAAGGQGLELQPHHTHRLLDGTDDPGALVDAAAAAGVGVAAVMCGFLHDEASLDAHRRTATLAARLGADVIPILPPPPGRGTLAELAGLLDALAADAGPLGVRLAVHHHAATIVEGPAQIDELLGLVAPEVAGLCFDTAHYALYADDEADAARRYAARTTHVHVKDLVRRRADLGYVPDGRTGARAFRLPGDGVLDVLPAVRALHEEGYAGWAALEIENFLRPRDVSASLGLERTRGALA